MPKQVTHIRKGHLILNLNGVIVKDCKTINAAKRESREMQKAGHVIRAENYLSPALRKLMVHTRKETRLLGMSRAEVRRLQASKE